MKLSKTIKKHLGVEDYSLTDDCHETNLFHDVLLKEGWTFVGLEPEEIRRTGLFETVRDFLDAKPTKI